MAKKHQASAPQPEIDEVGEVQEVEEQAATPAGDNSRVWAVFGVASALAGATVAKKALNAGWKAATGKEPPANPADPDVEMWEAVAWAAVSGTAVALARMLASRRAANYFVKSTGHLPGQLAADKK